MTKLELNRMVDHEIQWLYYYTDEGSKLNLTLDSDIYRDLVVMGYCKTPTPLPDRCAICLLTNGERLDEGTDITTLKKSNGQRGEFVYTPLEVLILVFPQEKGGIIERLRPKPANWEPYYLDRKK
jgi:hypothetical protein